jgi:hypothetical protein
VSHTLSGKHLPIDSIGIKWYNIYIRLRERDKSSPTEQQKRITSVIHKGVNMTNKQLNEIYDHFLGLGKSNSLKEIRNYFNDHEEWKIAKIDNDSIMVKSEEKKVIVSILKSVTGIPSVALATY